jgi:serine/threonine-protein kinase
MGGVSSPPKNEKTPAPSGGGSFQRNLGLGLAVVGLAGVGVGSFAGLTAITKNNRANDHCPNDACDPDGLSLDRQANDWATVSTVSFIAGGVLLVGGAVLYILAPSARASGLGDGLRVRF